MDRLHLDLVAGARADMIAGALIAVGAPLEAAREALRQVGLGGLDVVADEAARAGLHALRFRVLWGGADLGLPPPPAWPGPRPRVHQKGGQRRRHPPARPRLDTPTRTAPLAAAATVAAVPELRGPDGIVSGGRGALDDRAGERALIAAARGKRRGAPNAPEQWLDGADAPASALVDVLRASDLEPIPKALALKAARRLVEALDVVGDAGDGHAPQLRGPRVARLLADLVSGAALVSALSPAAVTSSPLGLCALGVDDEGLVLSSPSPSSDAGAPWPAPSPWLLEVLAGVPVVERDDDLVTADVAGAALAWSLVHRFGARGVSTSTRQGAGASAIDTPGRALVARAIVGPPPFVATRAGAREAGASVVVEGRIDSLAGELDSGRLEAAVRARAGAALLDLEIHPSERPRGVRVRALLAPAGVDDATEALWRAGCVDVAATWVERRCPGVEEVTVPLGRGRMKASVRVRVLTNGDEILRIDPDTDDVRAAAELRGESVHAIAAAATAAAEDLARRMRSQRQTRTKQR